MLPSLTPSSPKELQGKKLRKEFKQTNKKCVCVCISWSGGGPGQAGNIPVAKLPFQRNFLSLLLYPNSSKSSQELNI